jgi:hypothetical protein
LRDDDAIVGFLYLGTPAAAPAAVPAPDAGSVVTRWTGPVAGAEP